MPLIIHYKQALYFVLVFVLYISTINHAQQYAFIARKYDIYLLNHVKEKK